MNFRFSFNLLFVTFAFVSLLALSSCTIDENGNVKLDRELSSTARLSKDSQVTEDSKYYSKGHYVFVDEIILDGLTPSNARIEIDISDQRARLYKTDGLKDKLALETQVSTGKASYPTPTGTYRIMEKSASKESNLYGKWVDNETGDVLVSDGDSREPPSSSNATFKGAKMPYWLRVTGGGVGLHVGYVPDGPASHGCIRVPIKIQPIIYKKVKVGTPVSIVN